MAKERLHGQAGAHIPDRDGTVCTATDEEVCEGLEVKTVNTVGMLAILLANFERMQIEQLDGAIC